MFVNNTTKSSHIAACAAGASALTVLALGVIGMGTLTIVASQGVNVGCFNAMCHHIPLGAGIGLCALPALVTTVVAPKIAESRRRTLIEEYLEIELPKNLLAQNAEHPLWGASADQIYLHSECVVKPHNERVLTRLQKAYTIAEKLHLDHITVPEALRLGRHMIVRRLPGDHATPVKGMLFYYTHQAEFTPAVIEFTTFLLHCRGTLKPNGDYNNRFDLAGNTLHELNNLGDDYGYLPRFDNLLLYEKQGAYCIAPIDVDDIEARREPGEGEDLYQAILASIELFPFHAEAIIEHGRGYGLTPTQEDQLRPIITKAKKLYKIAQYYSTHESGPNLTPGQKEAIITAVREKYPGQDIADAEFTEIFDAIPTAYEQSLDLITGESTGGKYRVLYESADEELSSYCIGPYTPRRAQLCHAVLEAMNDGNHVAVYGGESHTLAW